MTPPDIMTGVVIDIFFSSMFSPKMYLASVLKFAPDASGSYSFSPLLDEEEGVEGDEEEEEESESESGEEEKDEEEEEEEEEEKEEELKVEQTE